MGMRSDIPHTADRITQLNSIDLTLHTYTEGEGSSKEKGG
jgi:hypothetical protein